jgi:hypothetical protein
MIHNNNQIELHLERSSDAHAFAEKEVIHLSEYKRVKSWISKDIDESQKSVPLKGVLDRNRRHDTITILGTRGSGKTSFLLSILTWFKENRKDEVEVLEIIDPTLIEEKGHILLDVLAVIRGKVDEVLENNEVGTDNEFIQYRQKWRSMMEMLAHGLPHIDGIGGTLTETSWQDPEYIMQRGLRSVNAARNLEVNFTAAINYALKILGKKAFIIAFDDIDIDFTKGWPVLELLRKYFVSKQIITILSGDMRLYSLAVRKKQWLNFSKEVIKHEGTTSERLERLRELVTETESQYLQKVMKPSRRIHLTTLNEKLRVDRGMLVSVFTTPKMHVSITALYDAILSRYGILNNYQAEIYRSFLLNSPLRMQIRFLEINTVNEYADSDSILDPFISDLYEMRVDTGRITSSPQHLNISILELLLREKILSETNQLQPTTTVPALNGTLTALSFLFSETSVQNPDIIFDYFVRIGYVRNLLSSLGYQNDSRTESGPSIEELCKHSGILQDRVIKDNIGMVTAYMTAVRELDGSSDRPWAGMIPLRGLAGTGNLRSDLREDRIDFVARNQNPIQAALIYLPLSVSQSSRRQGGTVIYSFHVLIAAIAEFVRKSRHGDLFNGIAELSQLRSYPMPDFRQRTGTSNEVPEQVSHLEIEQIIDNRNDDMLEIMLKRWNESYENKATAPHVLGKIATRFFFAADAIQSEQKNEKLGDVMHALTVSFLNAVFIEDVKENIERPDINLNNTRMSDTILVNNLMKASSFDDDKLHLSRWIFSCPLLLVYLNPNSRLRELISDFALSNGNEHAFSFSVYNLLMRISPKYRLTKPRNFEAIISQLSASGVKTQRLEDAVYDESELAEITYAYQRTFPAEKMTSQKMRKVLEYYNLEDGE